MLLTSPAARKVPLGQAKLKLYLNKNIFNAVDIPMEVDKEGLLSFFSKLFEDCLQGAR